MGLFFMGGDEGEVLERFLCRVGCFFCGILEAVFGAWRRCGFGVGRQKRRALLLVFFAVGKIRNGVILVSRDKKVFQVGERRGGFAGGVLSCGGSR